jgi:aminoglycoside phosphotransferase (APT) family kinase protein
VLLGKMRAKGPDRRTPRVHDALRTAGLDGRADHGVGVPRVLGRIDALNMWLQEEVPGRTLAHHLDPAEPPQAEVFARTGAALARLHAVPAAVDRRWSLVDEAAVLERALDQAAQDMPEAGEALRAIGRASMARLERLGDAPVCGIHRDFYFDQVLVDGPRIWLLDLDLYTIGDPAIDIGNFLAHLDEFALRRFGDVNALDTQASAFLAGYAGVRSLPTAGRIATLRTTSLARHIHISTRFQDRKHITQDLISISLAALTDMESQAS